ncbi:hypothetical protein [Fundidesulfovibrio soli]|uniref:hypothetical protein n=1 Tax=Fundidesulfovibrio soli TaxID=2922716 RepID=UPI001FAECDEA|nr:hypothetical protein [Fundidesulfovibrio soli]
MPEQTAQDTLDRTPPCNAGGQAHTFLWRIALEARSRMEARAGCSPGDGVIALVFSFMALEAYVNFIGPRLDPLWPADFKAEKKYFGKLDTRGTVRKINYVARLAGLADFSEHARPLRTVIALRELRHALAHARPGKANGSLSELASPGHAEEAMRDVEELAEALHAATLRALADRNTQPAGLPALGLKAFSEPGGA